MVDGNRKFIWSGLTQATIPGIDAKFASSAIDGIWLKYRELANHQELNPGPLLELSVVCN